MNETRWTPEEFERLLSLPSNDPERRQADNSLAFQARALMQGAFAAPLENPLGAGERERVRMELAGRLERALALQIPPPKPADPATVRAASEPPRSARGPLAALAAWLASPRLRPAMAFAAVLVVAGLGWWSLDRPPAPRAVRSTAPEGAGLTLAAPAARLDGIELSWSASPGADSYRLVFYDDRIQELARLDGLVETRLVLRPDALPAGLARGADIEVEVQALLNGDVVATSRVRPLRVP